MAKKFLTEIVGEEFQNWKKGDVVFISTPTGSGKTTFALGVYAVHIVRQGGKVLILEPRTILVQQLREECRKIFAENFVDYDLLVRGMEIWSYQKLEEKLENGNYVPDFDAIIADEAHYLLGDATFNANTALSYAHLLQQTMSGHSVVVMISATVEKIRETFLRDVPRTIGFVSLSNGGKMSFPGRMAFFYGFEPDYRYLDVKYLRNEEEMLELASGYSGKILWFCNSKKRGEKIYRSLEERGLEAAMITAENKMEEAARIVQSLASRGKFTQKILVATSVLDVGVSICDPEMQAVVLDTYERETFLQMLGRIRITEEGQRLDAFIFRRDAENYKNILDRQIIPQLDFIEEVAREKEEYRPAKIVEMMLSQPLAPSVYRQTTEILTNRLTNIRLNQLYLSYLKFVEGLQKDKDYAIKTQLGWLGLEDTFSAENYVDNAIQELKRHKVSQIIMEKGAKALEGWLSKEENSAFLESIRQEIRDLNANYFRSNTSLSVKNFNRICVCEDLPFFIVQTEVERKQIYRLVYRNDCAA